MKPTLRVWPLAAAIFFCVSGGPFGLEPVMQVGPGMAILLLLATPVIWSLPAALMTAELSSAMPEEGGYYVWVKRAMGKPWGFLCSWWSWVSSWVDVAIYPTLFAAYTGRFLHLLGFTPSFETDPLQKWCIALVLIIPLTWLNLRGIKLVGQSAMGFFVILLIPFVILVAVGMAKVTADPGAVTHPFVAKGDGTLGAFGAGLFAVMWNYLGWDMMSSAAGEVKDPQRAFPKAIAIAVPVVVITYLLPVIVGLVVLRDPTKWEEGAWVEVAALIGGKWLAISVAAAGIVSCAGLFSATLLSGSRIPFVLAEEGILPKWIAKLHPKYGTPWAAILVSAVFYTAFSIQSLKDLAVLDVVLYTAALLLEFIALAVLRLKEPNMPRPYKIPGGWPIIAFILIVPAALIAFACYSRYQEKGNLAVELSLAALATGPVVWLVSSTWRRITKAAH